MKRRVRWRIIERVGGMKQPTHGHDALEAEISTLLDTPVGDDRETLLARVEDTLTTGYARAHALEAERWRLDRRIARLAATLDDEDATATATEMKALARRASAAEDDRSRLLALLSSLRARASALRA